MIGRHGGDEPVFDLVQVAAQDVDALGLALGQRIQVLPNRRPLAGQPEPRGGRLRRVALDDAGDELLHEEGELHHLAQELDLRAGGLPPIVALLADLTPGDRRLPGTGRPAGSTLLRFRRPALRRRELLVVGRRRCRCRDRKVALELVQETQAALGRQLSGLFDQALPDGLAPLLGRGQAVGGHHVGQLPRRLLGLEVDRRIAAGDLGRRAGFPEAPLRRLRLRLQQRQQGVDVDAALLQQQPRPAGARFQNGPQDVAGRDSLRVAALGLLVGPVEGSQETRRDRQIPRRRGRLVTVHLPQTAVDPVARADPEAVLFQWVRDGLGRSRLVAREQRQVRAGHGQAQEQVALGKVPAVLPQGESDGRAVAPGGGLREPLLELREVLLERLHGRQKALAAAAESAANHAAADHELGGPGRGLEEVGRGEADAIDPGAVGAATVLELPLLGAVDWLQRRVPAGDPAVREQLQLIVGIAADVDLFDGVSQADAVKRPLDDLDSDPDALAGGTPLRGPRPRPLHGRARVSGGLLGAAHLGQPTRPLACPGSGGAGREG